MQPAFCRITRKLILHGGPKTGPLRFTACNFRSIDQIGTKCGTNQRYSFLTLPGNLFETTMENKVAPANE